MEWKILLHCTGKIYIVLLTEKLRSCPDTRAPVKLVSLQVGNRSMPAIGTLLNGIVMKKPVTLN